MRIGGLKRRMDIGFDLFLAILATTRTGNDNENLVYLGGRI
jgi:hypothetical protein